MTKTLNNYDRYCNYMREQGKEPISFKEFVEICIDLDPILGGGDDHVGSIRDFMGSNQSGN